MQIKDEFDLNDDFNFEKTNTDLFGVENFGKIIDTDYKKDYIILRKQKEALKEKVKEELKAFIKPINAEIIRNYIPKKGQTTFFLMNGNCEFVDFIAEFIKNVGTVQEIILTTLSANKKSFESLDEILPNLTKHVLISSYFLATDKSKTLPTLKEEKKLNKYNIGFFRNHTKLCLIKTDTDFYLFSGSANLRSSGTIEQFTIFSSKELYEFNKQWILFLIEKYNFDKSYKEYKNTGKATFDFLGEFDF